MFLCQGLSPVICKSNRLCAGNGLVLMIIEICLTTHRNNITFLIRVFIERFKRRKFVRLFSKLVNDGH